ncbi:MAG: hypothetical protein K2N01_04220 [Lachnospiraceae bacterium]|nr:hypothetical protein [Lachnospiraceae bacterium]
MLKKVAESQRNGKKVIHNEKCGNIEKNELYTELCTLSTEKMIKTLVYIAKK